MWILVTLSRVNEGEPRLITLYVSPLPPSLPSHPLCSPGLHANPRYPLQSAEALEKVADIPDEDEDDKDADAPVSAGDDDEEEVEEEDEDEDEE
jgi:hypothetical protein